jgi:DnaJ-class molecular chaperone
MEQQPYRTLYDVLGVSPDAPAEEIARAYQHRVAQFDTGHLGSLGPRLQEAADEELRWIEVAWETLGDPERRLEYDEALAMPVEAGPAEQTGQQPWSDRYEAGSAEQTPAGSLRPSSRSTASPLWNWMYYASLGVAGIGAAMLLLARGCEGRPGG